MNCYTHGRIAAVGMCAGCQRGLCHECTSQETPRLGGAALGLGVSVGGFAVGSIAIGGAAAGFVYAIGGGAFGPAVIDGRHCDEAARAFGAAVAQSAVTELSLAPCID